jgi:hypothetical protein
MKYGKFIPLVALLFALTSCYSANITTDKQPSAQTIEKKWAHGFIGGLVMIGAEVDASQCNNGVAAVETKLSFVNMLVNGITGGLYTPMSISVTCAAGGMSSADIAPDKKFNLSKDVSKQKAANTVKKAANKSANIDGPVYVTFE